MKLLNESLTIVIPCLNEGRAIGEVVKRWTTAFPAASIVVVDNGSSDNTAEQATSAGAAVLSEHRPGKARAMLLAFEKVNSPLMLMVDGDDSYLPEGGEILLQEFERTSADMIVGRRVPTNSDPKCFRLFHSGGTRAFAGFLSFMFGIPRIDPFSGLRLFSRRFYKSVPLLSRGFELEMELEIQASEKGFQTSECDVPFQCRFEGTHSKLSKRRDVPRILVAMLRLFLDLRPFQAFLTASIAMFMLGLLAGMEPIRGYFATGLVNRFPLAILAASFMILSFLFLATGVILESILRHHKENFQIMVRSLQSGRSL